MLEVLLLGQQFLSIHIGLGSTIELGVLIHFLFGKLAYFLALLGQLFDLLFQPQHFVTILVFLGDVHHLGQFFNLVIQTVFLIEILFNAVKA